MPARTVFLDTNGWIALLNSSDSLHEAARQTWASLLTQGCSVFLTDWIIAETGNGLARTQARDSFASAVRAIQTSTKARLIPISQTLFENALSLYTHRPDKTWGLVDCASFVIMQDHGIREAFTNDGTSSRPDFNVFCLCLEQSIVA